jgi:hypothetical protein
MLRANGLLELLLFWLAFARIARIARIAPKIARYFLKKLKKNRVFTIKNQYVKCSDHLESNSSNFFEQFAGEKIQNYKYLYIRSLYPVFFLLQ